MINRILASFKRITNKYFNEELDIHLRMLNLIIMVSLASSVFSFTSVIVRDFDGAWINIFTYLVLAVILWVSNRWVKYYKVTIIVLEMLINVIILPLMYIKQGGMHSGMPIWLLFGLVLPWLISSGVTALVLFIAGIIASSIVVWLEFYMPEMITPLATKYDIANDVFQSLLVVATCMAIIWMYQLNLVRKQSERIIEQQKDLQIALAETQRANNAKSDFLANMSHEIRTPINAILGMNELILRDADDYEILQHSNNIKTSGESLMLLVNDILDISKIESGKMELAPYEYHLDSTVRDAYNMLQFKAHEKNLDFIIDMDTSIPTTLLGDEIYISQILTNLLNNAIKYTKQGFVKLKVISVPEEDNKIMLTFEVSDSGIGIAEENIKNPEILFSSFERLDLKKNRNIEGTGLGLSITKALVSIMGGTITVDSKLNEGSTFTVKLPQKIVDSTPINTFSLEEKTLAPIHRSTYTAPKAKILIVDDVDMNIKVLSGLLKYIKCQMDSALSGNECIEKCKTTKYDLILLDHMMPEPDGIETLQIIKEIIEKDSTFPNKNTPIIVQTANAAPGMIKIYKEQGFADCIIKPIQGHKLEEIVKEHLKPELIEELKINSSSTDIPDVSSKDTVDLSIYNVLPGIDAQNAMQYCCDDISFYNEMLKNYLSSDKRPELHEALEQKDMAVIERLYHSIKGLSRTIGAQALSDEAKKREFLAKDKDLDTILAISDEFEKEYSLLLDAIRNFFN